jgi:hypothetical protein
MPHEAWGGVKPVQGSEDTGYCTHSSVLFPTWHRAYMALYEVRQNRRPLLLLGLTNRVAGTMVWLTDCCSKSCTD